MGLADSFAPVLLTVLCISWGAPGWLVVGAMFAIAGVVMPSAVRWAEATRAQLANLPA